MAEAKVTIFPGPGDNHRVRELLPGCEAQTVKWSSDYDGAVEFLRENYDEEQAVSPDEFRQAYKQCKGGK
jgi:hypothetical protein